jgi:hypothetical protein
MKDNALASLVLAEVIYHSEEALENQNTEANDEASSTRTTVNKYYLGNNAEHCLTNSGASAALTRLEESLVAVKDTAVKPKASKHPYSKIDVGWSMQVMDLMFKASFSDFVRLIILLIPFIATNEILIVSHNVS